MSFAFTTNTIAGKIIRTLLKMVVGKISTNMENIGRVIHAILNWFLRISVSLWHTNLKQYVFIYIYIYSIL